MNKTSIYFLITNRCNLSCAHCIRKKQNQNIKYQKIDMPIAVAKQKLKEISTIISNAVLIISGGEPTLYTDFDEILNFAIKCFKHVSLTTNGTFNSDICNSIKKYKNNLLVQVSVDGDREIHDEIRGIGTFDILSYNVKELLKNNIKVVIHSVVNSKNIKSMFNLAKIINELPILYWKISYQQTFNDNCIKPVEINDWNTFVDNIIKKAKCRLHIKKLYDFKLWEKFEDKYGKGNIIKNIIPNCGYGKTKMYINPDFSVNPCTCIKDHIIGNLLTDRFDKVIEIFNKIKCEIKKESICNKCRWLYLCNGGCQGYSFHFFKQFGMGDIRCPIVKEEFNRL